MTLTEIKEKLYYNDLRNPNIQVDEEATKEIAENPQDCYCDNCFYGKTPMTEELLKYYEALNNVPSVSHVDDYKTILLALTKRYIKWNVTCITVWVWLV